MGRTIVITGATGVLGGLTARAFAERGDSLALLDKNQEKLDSLFRKLNLPDARIFTLKVDLRDGQALHSAAEAVSIKFGSMYALIHLLRRSSLQCCIYSRMMLRK